MKMKFGMLCFLSLLLNVVGRAQVTQLDEGLSDGDWELCISISGDESVAMVSKFSPFTVFVMERQNGNWSEQKLLPFSGEYQDGGPDISLDGQKVYFSSSRPVDVNDSTADSDLWMSQKEGEIWSDPVHLGLKLNTADDELSPSLAKSGNLYFMKDAEDGHGGYDIYVSEFKNGVYEVPRNLGSSINSEYNEEDPFIDPDERFIVFMSQRPDDAGACDLYISLRKNDQWGEAISLGTTVNTPTCDYSPFITRSGDLYFISYSEGALNGKTMLSYKELVKKYRSAGNGKADIYKINWEQVLNDINIELR